MKKDNLSISTINTIIEEGKTILYISENRETAVNSKNVKGKIKSLKEYGVCSPIMLLPAKFAAEEKLTLLDENLSEVKDSDVIDNAFVILDGNNRYKAYLKIKAEKKAADAKGKEYDAGKGLEDIPCIIQSEKPSMGTLKTLIEMNTTAISWAGKDYVKTAFQMNPDDEVMKFVKEMSDKKMSLNTIGLFLSFNGGMPKDSISSLIKEGKMNGEFDVTRARKVYDALINAGFEQSIINKRYLIKFIMSKADKLDKVLDAFESLSSAEVKYISENMSDYFDAFGAVKDKMNK